MSEDPSLSVLVESPRAHWMDATKHNSMQSNPRAQYLIRVRSHDASYQFTSTGMLLPACRQTLLHPSSVLSSQNECSVVVRRQEVEQKLEN